MSKKIYLPKNENLTELFSISSSKDGIVIPLVNFGYSNYHITIYSKKRVVSDSSICVNIHIKDEKTRRKIFNKNLFLDEKKLDDYFIEKIEKLKEIVLFHNDLFIKTSDRSKNMVCAECYGVENFKLSLDKRNIAKKSFESLSLCVSDINLDLLKKNTLASCTNSKHKCFYDLDEKKSFIRLAGNLVPYEDIEPLIDDITEVFRNELDNISVYIDSLKKDINICLNNNCL